MGAILVPIIAVLILLAVGAALAKQLGGRTTQQQEDVRRDDSRLQYRVSGGQDPAAVLVALSRAGFEAVPDRGDSRLINIPLPIGPEQREEVRTALANESTMALEDQESEEPDVARPTGRVQFLDE